MRKRIVRWRKNSLSLTVTISVVIMTLPLVGMLIYNNFYAIHVVREQVSSSYKNSLSLYMGQIDSDLNEIHSYINTISSRGPEITALEQSQLDEDYFMAKVYLQNRLIKDSSLYPSVDAFFVYVGNRKEFMDTSGSYLSFEQKEKVQNYLINLVELNEYSSGSKVKKWHYHKIGEDYYLVDIVRSGNTYLGAYAKASELMQPLRSLEVDGGATLLGNNKGEPLTQTQFVQDYEIELKTNKGDYYLSGENKKFLVVGAESIRGNFNLYTLIPDNHILSDLPYLQRLVWLITIGAIFFVPVGLYHMRKSLLTPLYKLLFAMKMVRDGNWNTRVEMPNTSEEFKLLGNSFNKMMEEIQALRINVYEEQLNKQREELHRLQIQVNPHFFLNSLNIVYNMAKVKNYDLIMQMTMSLIHYFRFLFRSNSSFVKLTDELDHTRNYLTIQTLRFPSHLTWNLDAPDYLTEVHVPPLVIQSFVENAIKHAITMDKPIHVSVTIAFEDEETGSEIVIKIKDTGKGFDDKVLSKLQSGLSVENERGERTGIWNVQRRLMLLYRESASLGFRNDENTGGAVVEMTLPTYLRTEGIDPK